MATPHASADLPSAAVRSDPGPGEPDTTASAPPRRRRRGIRVANVVAVAVFAVAGMMFVAGAKTSQGGDLRVDSTGSLRDAIAQRASENAQLQGRVDSLSAQILAEQQQSDSGPALTATQESIEALSPAAALTEVRGPGVTVTLDDADAPDPLPDGMNGDDYLVHQQDVQGVVNALWRGGASGVTVMGQRLANTSAVRCVGNTVILQGRVYSPPFVIEGVGNVAALEAALDADPSVSFFRQWADVVGLRYDQARAAELVLPPYTGPISPKYASVAR